jgi:hypothetical protein
VGAQSWYFPLDDARFRPGHHARASGGRQQSAFAPARK